MHQTVGLDLNGWRDFGVRAHDVDEPDITCAADVSVDGGYGGVVVSHRDMTIGGPQAILSPIGRGNGWGLVGAQENRRDLRTLWSTLLAGTSEDRTIDDIQIAADALAVRANSIALCIPDRPEMAEACQQALLNALAGPRRPPAKLIWRTVALALAALDGGLLPEARDGMRVLCVIHAADGLEVQPLTMRALPEHPGTLAPERAGAGSLLCREVGLACLLADAEAAVEKKNPQLRERPTEVPRLPLSLLLNESEPAEPEVIRRDNATWTLAHPPASFRVHWERLTAPPALEAADVVLLHSPLAARHRDGLATWLGVLSGTLRIMGTNAAAHGALHAGRRIARGVPHYLDRLDQVSLAVEGRAGPVFEDLIKADAIVWGNREYVSDPITTMSWPKGMETANFFIRKGEHEIRKGTATVLTPPEENQQLEIRLRQTPAQGWANLTITAPRWDNLGSSPIRLEWSELRVDPRSAQEILDSLQGPRPTVPDAVHYRADIGLWDGSLRTPELNVLLQRVRRSQSGSLKVLADALASPYSRPDPGGTWSQRVYPVGTDGSLPQGLDRETEALFENTIESVASDLMRRRRRGQAPATNDELRCLTWCFARCPTDVIRELALVARLSEQGEPHPWLQQPHAIVVVFQGLGRVATEPDLLEQMIPQLARGRSVAHRAGALAAMLSRPEATPAVLAKLDLSDLATRLADMLDEVYENQRFGVNLKYTLLAIGGLLRVRTLEPWALVADRSAPADRLAKRLDDVARWLTAHPSRATGVAVKRNSAAETAKYLRGEGGRPDILAFVDGLPDN